MVLIIFFKIKLLTTKILHIKLKKKKQGKFTIFLRLGIFLGGQNIKIENENALFSIILN